MDYTEAMIKSFKNKHTKAFYEGETAKKWDAFRRQAEKRLHILDFATSLDDLRGLPSNHVESLKGDRKGQYSIRINSQWRICFSWIRNEVHDVEIVDYH